MKCNKTIGTAVRAVKFYLAAYEKESPCHDMCGTTKFVTLRR